MLFDDRDSIYISLMCSNRTAGSTISVFGDDLSLCNFIQRIYKSYDELGIIFPDIGSITITGRDLPEKQSKIVISKEDIAKDSHFCFFTGDNSERNSKIFLYTISYQLYLMDTIFYQMNGRVLANIFKSVLPIWKLRDRIVKSCEMIESNYTYDIYITLNDYNYDELLRRENPYATRLDA